MKTHPRSLVWLLSALVAGLLGSATCTARGQSIYLVQKSQNVFQAASAGPIADPVVPFTFSVKAQTAGTVTLPAGTTVPVSFVANNGDYEILQSFPTKAALDAAFPDGTYRMTGTGLPALSFNLTTDLYPIDTPQVTSVTNGTWNNGVLVVDPTKATTININTFTGYATSGVGGHMQFKIQGQNDNVSIGGNGGIVSVPNSLGLPVQSTPLTSQTIPAGTLIPGHVYQAEVNFDTATTFDLTSVPGSAVVALFSTTLNFFLAAQTPGTSTPPPVITAQPANQTGVAGGSATFNLGVTVGGSSQASALQNLTVNFYFNGQQLNLDGTKYAFSSSGFGVTINHLTAADVGSYSATLINAGGIVASTPATLTLVTAAAPAITRPPASQTISSGSTVVFSVAATGAPAPTYQWMRTSGQPGAGTPALIPGATSATLVLSGLTGNNAAVAANYAVVVSNGVGSPLNSAPATLTVVATPDVGRLTNLSVLTGITAGVPNFTVATVVGGAGTSGTKPLVVRADGPSLGALGVAGTISDPQFTLFNSSSVAVVSNDNWGSDPTAVAALTTAMAGVGAFAFTGPTSKDAATYLPNLAPGGYTVTVSGVGGATGTALAEIYDATPAGTYNAFTPRLINVSTLKQLSAGGSLTLGFTIGGSSARTVLIRAIGPGLAGIGIASGTLVDPQLTLYNSGNAVIATNNDWGGDPQISSAGARVGAFAIANPASKDSMLLVTLPPGGYTATASGADGGGGLAIVEVYEVP